MSKAWRPQLPAKSGSLELQHEFVYRHLGTKYDRVAGILGMAQEIRFRHEPESRRLYLPPQRRLFDAMQGLPDACACARLSRMAADPQPPPRLKPPKHPPLHLRP